MTRCLWWPAMPQVTRAMCRGETQPGGSAYRKSHHSLPLGAGQGGAFQSLPLPSMGCTHTAPLGDVLGVKMQPSALMELLYT